MKYTLPCLVGNLLFFHLMRSFKGSALALSTLRIYSLFHCPLLAIFVEVLSVSELSHGQCPPDTALYNEQVFWDRGRMRIKLTHAR